MANRLQFEASPYLLQHAHNPVDWYPWGPEALNTAKEQDKLILVSVGYSACHWCHVMERECFENPEVAAVMNTHFICIKVDREEHPDVDALYMEAVSLMGIHGGWPLNVFTLPDGRPFYGGTYFPPRKWVSLLADLASAFKSHRPELEESGREFLQALQRTETEKYSLGSGDSPLPEFSLLKFYESLEPRFDRKFGGMAGAPKFPMPGIYRLLLHLYAHGGIPAALAFTEFTLTAMASGGIYDQAGGGFSRYSVDEHWFAPHFEKMLYDNGQLLSLYAEAYTASKNPLFENVIEQTIAFIKRELTSPEGGFYAALDADSEGHEGLFYTWTDEEFREALGAEANTAAAYYNVMPAGNWEEGRNILYRSLQDPAKPAQQNTDSQIQHERKKAELWNAMLLAARSAGIRPGLDSKILCGWNGLMMKGLADAYRSTGKEQYLSLAEANAEYISAHFYAGGKLYRTLKNNKPGLAGCLEDYAMLIEGLIGLYQAGFNENRLQLAKQLCADAINLLFDDSEGLFRFAQPGESGLPAEKKDIFDNVTPCGNSVMAHNLLLLGAYFDNTEWTDLSVSMLSRVSSLIQTEVRYLNNWARLAAMQNTPFAEIAISGKDYKEFALGIDSFYFPNKIMAASELASELPLLEFREPEGDETLIYVCFNKTCQKPVSTVAEAIDILKGVLTGVPL